MPLDRDALVELILECYLTNNELRTDLNKGMAINKQIPVVAIATMFDLADAVLAEALKRQN